MKEIIITQIKELVGEGMVLYFDKALLVKVTPHTWPVQIWAVCVKDNRIALQDGVEMWHELEETDKNYPIVLSSLYQRIQTIYKQVKIVA
jgi:hypothetical protein